jgi:hypothetical protein
MKRLLLSTLGCALALALAHSARAQAPAAPTPELAPFPAPEAAPPAAPAPATPGTAPSPATTPPSPAQTDSAPPTPAPASASEAAAAEPPARRHRHSKAPVSAPSAPPAVAADLPPVLEGSALPAATTPLLSLWLGATDTLVATPGFDPFATDNQLPTFHAEAAWGFGKLRGTQLALAASCDLGGTSASDRGEETNLDQLRLGLGPEVRVPIFDRFYVLGRVAPEAVRLSTELHESGGALLRERSWAFGVDAALGAALRLADIPTRPDAASLGVFVRLEAGYSWTASHDVRLQAASGSAPLRTAPVALGELALRGASLSGAIGIGY